MFTRTLKLLAPVLFSAAFALGGCASANPDIEREDNLGAASEAATAADGPHGPRGMHGHPLLAEALKDLDLSADQRKTIEAAVTELDSSHQGQMKAFHKALADDVRAGKIDEAAIKAKMGDVDKAAAERRAAVVKAVGTLHSTLTPEQRTQLVAQVKERMQKFADKHGEHGKKGHGKGGEGHGPGMHRGGPMMFLLHGLDLTDQQKEQIRAAMPPKPEMDEAERTAKREEHRAQMEKALEAFQGATFDAAAVLPEREHKAEHVEHFIKMLKAAVPVLTVEQRAELAKRLEEGPRMGPGGRHGRGHGGRGHHGDHDGDAAE